jgi:ribosomal protein S12 methylthiotransferase
MIKKYAAKIGILSLGCPRNLVDSESILGRLRLKGYEVVEMEEADIGIVNTCAFIEDAKTESVDAIMDLIDLKKKGKLKKIIVYGCLAGRYKEKLAAELPEIDAFIGVPSLNHGLERYPITPKHYAYLKICEGCINRCSYCIIPKIKPNFRSLEMNSVLKRLEAFNQDKISELNIVGQDITGYGKDLYGVYRLPELLKKIVNKANNIGWIRLLYLYPGRVSDELLRLIADSPAVCKYIDLPLQHINSRILKLMHRGVLKEDILRLIEKARKKIPDVAIRTSLIVGFPSETEKEFAELSKFVDKVKFERLGVFIYSREEGTSAFNLKKQISQKIKAERFNVLMSRQQIISQEINQKFLGKTIDVLIDEKEEGGTYLGRSQYDAPEVDGQVFVKSKRLLKPGDFIQARITDTLEYDLVGEAN